MNSYKDSEVTDYVASVDPLLSIRDLCVVFENSSSVAPGLLGVNFSLYAGQTIAIIGESGSGKSLTAASIMGLLTSTSRISAGKIQFEGRDMINLTPGERRAINGLQIGMIFQDTLAAFNPVFTVGAQIEEVLRLHGSRARSFNTTIALMTRVGISEPERRFYDYPHQFSGGQRQRLMIAMAIAMKPKLLIADEPTSALDASVQSQIITLLQDIQREHKMGIVFITHDIALARTMADVIVVMKDGRVIETATAEALFVSPRSEYTKMLLASVPGKGEPADSPVPSTPLLVVNNLTKNYRQRGRSFLWSGKGVTKALNGATFVLGNDEIVCVVGESGSGKSTLVRTLLGLEKPDCGTVLLDGELIDFNRRGDVFSLRACVQTVFQDPTSSLDPLMSIEQIITQPLSLPKNSYSKESRKNEVHRLLLSVGLTEQIAHRYPHELSGGQLQRVAIARALASKPRILIADEAVSALDVSVQSKVIQLLLGIKKERGLSLLFVTHDLALVKDFADRVLVMSDGTIVEQGSTKQIFSQPQHPYTKELLHHARRKNKFG